MARVTVEDCVDKIPNRFRLVLLAAHRARVLSAGNASNIEKSYAKPTVVALREIEEKVFSQEQMEETLIHELQHHVEIDEPEEDSLDEQALIAEKHLIDGDDNTRTAVGGFEDAEEIDEPEDGTDEPSAGGGFEDDIAAFKDND